MTTSHCIHWRPGVFLQIKACAEGQNYAVYEPSSRSESAPPRALFVHHELYLWLFPGRSFYDLLLCSARLGVLYNNIKPHCTARRPWGLWSPRTDPGHSIASNSLRSLCSRRTWYSWIPQSHRAALALRLSACSSIIIAQHYWTCSGSM